ncbi:MAG: hypothetical protein II922_06835 [Succinimonas sp.]|jgi:hypothetical protein|nr:hypothetical protein [Succinimonas sp.]
MKQFRDPRLNRMAGYAIMFSGFGVLAFASAHPGENGAVTLFHIFLFIISGALLVFSGIWMFKTVRCPHCKRLLHLKLYNIDVCPWCHYPTDPDNPVYDLDQRGRNR